MGVCNCSMFCCTLLYVHSSIAIILMGKRELIALLNLSSWCLVMVEWLFLAVPRGCLQFVIVVFPDHTHLLLLKPSHGVLQLLKKNFYSVLILHLLKPLLSVFHVLQALSIFCFIGDPLEANKTQEICIF